MTFRFGGFGKGSCASPRCSGTRKGKASIRQPDKTYKKTASPLCPRCIRYYQGKGTLKEGVGLVKKRFCENYGWYDSIDEWGIVQRANRTGCDMAGGVNKGALFPFLCRTIHDADGTIPNGLLHLDHIVSERDNGPNTADNLRTLCSHCHSTISLSSGDYVNRPIHINKEE
jgi:hypothetical protein